MENIITADSDIFQIGSQLAAITGSAICLNGNKEFDRLKVEGLKSRIMEYLVTNKRANIADLAAILDVPPRTIGRAIHELEDEGKIKDTD